MIKILLGNLFESKAQTLVNTINCVGVMGKGLALAFKKRYPDMYADYVERCSKGLVRPGEPYLYRDLGGLSILNFPTKRHWREGSKPADIAAGLDFLARHYREWGIRSIAIPPLGCGNGGLQWAEVAPMVIEKLGELPVDVELYAPQGTPAELLTTEGIMRSAAAEQAWKLPPAYAVIVEVLSRLRDQHHFLKIGRVVFQKICFILTALGVPTELVFGKGTYGPYAAEARDILQHLTQRGYVSEVRQGKNVLLVCAKEHPANEPEFAALIRPYEHVIARTVDLFCRIHSTAQAEKVATVLFSAQRMKGTQKDKIISEQELCDYVLEWKPRWGSGRELDQVVETIHCLRIMHWVKLQETPGFYRAEWDFPMPQW